MQVRDLATTRQTTYVEPVAGFAFSFPITLGGEAKVLRPTAALSTTKRTVASVSTREPTVVGLTTKRPTIADTTTETARP